MVTCQDHWRGCWAAPEWLSLCHWFLFHVLNPCGQFSLSLHFLKLLFCCFHTPQLFVLTRWSCLLFWEGIISTELQSFGEHWNCCNTTHSNFSVFSVTGFCSPLCLSMKAIFWLKTRARRWTLTSFNSSCWISERQSGGVCVSSNTFGGLTSQSCLEPYAPSCCASELLYLSLLPLALSAAMGIIILTEFC